MSKMFDDLRRAEEQRKNAQGEGVDEAQTPIEVRPAEPAKPPDPAALNGMPDEFVRELGVLRNSLDKLLSQRKKKALVFTSSSHGEGTTTLVTNFARLLAVQSGERILLLEMNARKPSLFWKMGLKSEVGVTHFLSQQVPFSAIVQKSAGGAFDVAHVGEKDPAKIQLHLDRLYPKLLEEATAAYDTVLVDAPPVVGSPETPPVTAHADGVVLVVQSGRTKREIVSRSLEMIELFDGNVLGVILNRKKYYIPEFIYRRI